MAKFAPTNQSPEEVIGSLRTPQKQADAYQLLALHQKVSGQNPLVWYPGIIGFGHYRYQYESGHEGDAPLIAFAPRQARISLYLEQDFPERDQLLAKLGKIKVAVGCVYITKLADIDLGVLEELLTSSLKWTKDKWLKQEGQ